MEEFISNQFIIFLALMATLIGGIAATLDLWKRLEVFSYFKNMMSEGKKVLIIMSTSFWLYNYYLNYVFWEGIFIPDEIISSGDVKVFAHLNSGFMILLLYIFVPSLRHLEKSVNLYLRWLFSISLLFMQFVSGLTHNPYTLDIDPNGFSAGVVASVYLMLFFISTYGLYVLFPRRENHNQALQRTR